jgi:transcriptional regulator with XRE-family HTH domain
VGIVPATNLEALLSGAGVPDWEVGATTGIHPSTISRYRRGVREIPLRHAQRLADYFGVELGEVIGSHVDALP